MAAADDEEEDRLLRSVALQNAQAILLARHRAERELLEAKEALEHKTAELAHSLAMMRATLESATDGILVTKADGHVTDFNHRFVEMWRIPRELMASMEHRILMEITGNLFEDPAAFRLRVEEIYAMAPPETYDLLELADGRAVERFSKTQRIEERNVGRVWSFRDITERRRTERKLRDQSEWFSVTLGSIGDAVITVGTECRITFLNAAAEKLTGWTAAEAIGRRVEEVMRMVSETNREPARNPVHEALEIGRISGLANPGILIRRDGSETLIEDSAAPIKNAADTIIGAVMVFHDVTERRQKELALQRSYQAEQEARAVAEHASQAKDHFLAALSHELRTPLTPVLAILSTLREETAIPEVFAEDLETVRRNVELEARLIDDLLDLTRITQGKLHLHYKPVAVSQLIEDAINTCLPDLRLKRLTLTRQLIEPHPTVEVDGARVTQILWNLLKNAIKFTPTKGAITIRLSTTGKQNAGQLVIEVQDTGIGLEPADLERIFQAFEQGGRTTSRQFGGLGLGLAISRAIAEAHRGTLFALSEGKGCGSTFILTIPWAGHESPNAMEPAVSGSRPFLFPAAGNVLERPLRILLVEDHEDTAIIMARLLRRMGHDVMHAGTVHAAIALADQEMQSGRIDLLMSDLGLPDGSGQDLMRILCSRYQLKGIALSGYGMESDLEESMAAGFARHLIKPIDIALLRNTIAELMYP